MPGALVKVANTSPFDVPVANSNWLASLHGFNWLPYCALSAQRGATAAAFYVQDWIGAIGAAEEAMRSDVCLAVDELERCHAHHLPALERREIDTIRQALSQQSNILRVALMKKMTVSGV